MLLNEFKQVYLMGVIVGVVIIILGFTSILYYFANGINGRYLFAGVGCIFAGSLFLFKSIPAFIPIKQKTSAATSYCPNCGSIVEEDALVCQKCKRAL
jgi:hypothetical protein